MKPLRAKRAIYRQFTGLGNGGGFGKVLRATFGASEATASA
jgi:hypothetical protein